MQKPPEATITVDLVPDNGGVSVVGIKLQSTGYEMNLLVPFAEVPKLSDLPSWEPGARQIGTVAGLSAFWSSDENVVSILVGVDDECWEFGVWITGEAYQQIVKEAECLSRAAV